MTNLYFGLSSLFNFLKINIIKGNNLSNPIILQGEAAITLWLKGVDAWNFWVAENPEADVIFEGVDFHKLVEEESKEYSFIGFKFPNGNINFSKANFSKGIVNFKNAKFGGGIISFKNANFANSTVCFEQAFFNDGDISFYKAAFDSSKVNFKGCKFGEGNINFCFAHFSKELVDFSNVHFGDGDVIFNYALFDYSDTFFSYSKFSKGRVSFNRARFNEGVLSFSQANLGTGEVNFDYARFNDLAVTCNGTIFGGGDVSFNEAKFVDSSLSLNRSSMGKGKVSFIKADFDGHLSLNNLVNSENITELNFRFSSFQKSVDLSGNLFYCVPDFTNTKTAHHLDLDNFKCIPKFKNKKIEDEKDIARLCRLKEIAESNKDHEAALEFNALEFKAKRWAQFNVAKSILDMFYSGFSDYGRSIVKPFLALITSMIVFSCYYFYTSLSLFNLKTLGCSIELATSNSVPFLSISKELKSHAIEQLYQINTLPDLFGFMSVVQGILSFIFLFLIGLALRNRFRL